MRNNLQKSLHHFSICCVLMRPDRGQIYYYVQSIAQVIIFVNFTAIKMLYQVKDRMCRWCFRSTDSAARLEWSSFFAAGKARQIAGTEDGKSCPNINH